MKKTIAVVSYDERAGEFYGAQIRELFQGFVNVHTYSVLSDTIKNIQKSDLYLVSTDAFEDRDKCSRYISAEAEIVDIYTTFTKDTIFQLSKIPKGTKAMLVNLSYKMTREIISSLSSFGINQIEFYSVYPGLQNIPAIDFAITPSEIRYVPKHVTNIMDLGQRVLDTSTIVETALKLNLDHLLEDQRFQHYFNSIATSNYSFNRLFNRSVTMESWFELLLSTLDHGIIGMDETGTIFACNHKVLQILGLQKEALIGKKQKEVLSFLPIESYSVAIKSGISKIIRINKADIHMNIMPVVRNEKFLGVFVQLSLFKEEEAKQNNLRIQLLNKGHKAKYKFEDISRKNLIMEQLCTLAQRMAKTSSTILITGESGTGKELFSHAIHHASSRNEYPFIAINCAAMPDNLLESELFGYEEGAFTGARKGGKLGLFEFAHKGTLFLDEIEGMSPALQIKLLRVIQEKEILRIGGNTVIPIDVRIVAATNEHLDLLVQNGSFRKDLYYRLNVLQLNIPPLRARKEDILILLESMKRELGGHFRLTQEVQQILLQHPWEGNVRELRNYVEYFICLDQNLISIDDLPEGLKQHTIKSIPIPKSFPEITDTDLGETYAFMKQQPQHYAFLLGELTNAYVACQPVGRKSLALRARECNLYLTEQEIKTMLVKLCQAKLVISGKGRGGSKITCLGKELYQSLGKK